MELLRTILTEISTGKRSFNPADGTSKAVIAFQPVARRLLSAEQQGLVTGVRIRTSHSPETYGNVLGVVVRGGITFKGEQLLSAEPEAKAIKEQEAKAPILQLKPAFAGMSVDLIALYKRLAQWWNRPRCCQQAVDGRLCSSR